MTAGNYIVTDVHNRVINTGTKDGIIFFADTLHTSALANGWIDIDDFKLPFSFSSALVFLTRTFKFIVIDNR